MKTNKGGQIENITRRRGKISSMTTFGDDSRKSKQSPKKKLTNKRKKKMCHFRQTLWYNSKLHCL